MANRKTVQFDDFAFTVHRETNRHRLREATALMRLFARIADGAPADDVYGRLRYAAIATHTDFSPPGAFPLPDADTPDAWEAAYARFLETDGAFYEHWQALDAELNPARYTVEPAVG